MLVSGIDTYTLALVVIGALLAGITTGMAGFGTALVASGFWYHVLPAAMVPPLVALTGVVGQLIGSISMKKSYSWREANPYLLGGLIGVPLGVLTLTIASPANLRIVVGAFLTLYASLQLLGVAKMGLNIPAAKNVNGAIGVGGGFLGGFAGLSGPLPIIWLQLQGKTSASQRAIYQPFNLVVLSLAVVGMALKGFVTKQVLLLFVICLPITVIGTLIGLYLYNRMSDQIFRSTILGLLLLSGMWLFLQSMVA